MNNTVYFANLRQINKLKMIVEEWKIQILELEAQPIDAELKALYKKEKQAKLKIEEYNLRKLKEQVKEPKEPKEGEE